MKNGARYVVTTHWGTFSLDEGTYQDYLAGRLWISWNPGKSEQPQQAASGYVPPSITDRAIALRDQADSVGILATLRQQDVCKAIVPYSNRLAELSINELNLSVRASNGLKRANVHTFGALKALLAVKGGLSNIRNIGHKSIKENEQQFFESCYEKLLPYEKAQYWQEVLDDI